MMNKTPSWIAIDWGTSSLRAWAMDDTCHPIATRNSNDGMSQLEAAAFEPALARLIDDWLPQEPIPLLACGMVGARQGWLEAPYSSTPTPMSKARTTVITRPTDPRYRLTILSGINQADPADVMRGEETQIAGYLSNHADFEGLLCLPGTHSKWAVVKDGVLQSFRSYMTGELYALISQQSVLRHSLSQDTGHTLRTDATKLHTAFESGVKAAKDRAGNVSSLLFPIRARSLLQEQVPAEAANYLSGLLIGAEIVDALALAKHEGFAQSAVPLIADPKLSSRYGTALEMFDLASSSMDCTEMTLTGLSSAYRQLKDAGQWPGI